MSQTFSKTVTLYTNSDSATMEWNFKINESGLTGSATYTPKGGKALNFTNVNGTVQYLGGIYNGPFTIDVTGGMDQNMDSISATISVNDDWASGQGGYLIELFSPNGNGGEISSPFGLPVTA